MKLIKTFFNNKYKFLNIFSRDILEAGATAFQLSNWSQYFYEFGMHLRALDHRDCERITGILNKVS